MPELSGAEAKSTIEEIWNSFSTLRSESEFDTRVLYGRHRADLVADLIKLKLTPQVPITSQSMDHYAHEAESQMADAIEFHVDAFNPRKRSAADQLEIAAAWSWNKIDVGGLVTQALIRGMVVSPFSDLWLVLNPFKLPKSPKDEKDADAKQENDDYRAAYFPVRAEVGNGHGSAFLEEAGKVTMGVRHITKSIAEAVRDYDKKPGDKRSAQQILEEDYRTQFGIAFGEEHSALSRRIGIRRIDDGKTICDYIEGLKDGSYSLISDQEDDAPWDNPFDTVSLFFTCGHFNADATTPEDRYQSFLRGLVKRGYDLDRMRSVLASLSAKQSTKVLQLLPGALENLTGKSTADAGRWLDSVPIRERNGWTVLLGEAKQLDMPVPALLEKEIQETKEDIKALLPTVTPSDELVRSSTASAIELQVDGKQKRYQASQRRLSGVVHDVVEAVFQCFRERETSPVYNRPGAANMESLHVLTTAAERVQGKKVDAGNNFSIGPEELGTDSNWYRLSVYHVDESPAARASRRQEAEQRRLAGSIVQDDYLALLGVTDTTGYQAKIEIQSMRDMYRQGQQALAYASAMRHYAAVSGQDLASVLAVTQGGPVPVPGGQPGQTVAPPSGPTGAGSIVRQGSPAPNQAPVGVSS